MSIDELLMEFEDLKIDNEYLKKDNDSLKAEKLALQNKIKELEFKYNDLFIKYAETQNKSSTPKIIYKENKRMEGEITQWEYKTVPTHAYEDQELNKLGNEGWEAVAAKPNGAIVMKRQKKETKKTPTVYPER